MARTESKMLPLGTISPTFALPNVVTNQIVTTQKAYGKHGLVVMFICNHCPFVKHVIDELIRIANDYRVQGFGFVAISSNDTQQYPEDAPEEMAKLAEKHLYPFPYLYDETQEVAKAYDAACTPDFYVFNSEQKLVYRGQLDNSRPGNSIQVTGRDLREAIDNVLSNSPQREDQKPSLGCNIKWKV